MRSVHAIPGPEVAMNFPRPDEIIEQLTTEFLADQEAYLSRESYRQYAHILDLLELYLERRRPGRRRPECGATARPGGASCGLPGAADLTRGSSEFLGDFLPHEIGASTETLRAARVVIETLGAWLAAKGYVTRDQTARKRVGRVERPSGDPEPLGPIP
jgi:hypothetical protein